MVQFSISLIFIISTALIFSQTKHLLNFNFGFDKTNVINVKLYKLENYDRFAQAIASNKDILAVSACDILPAAGSTNGTVAFSADLKDSLQVSYIDIDAKCLDVWGLQLVAGKNFPATASISGEQHVLLNETMVKKMKFSSSQSAIGQHIVLDGNSVEIVGVVKDFQYLDVSRRIESLVLRNRQAQFGYITIKITGKNTPYVVRFLESTWQKTNPAAKFEYEFFDQQLFFTHHLLQNAANVLGFIAFLAVFISCLGLLGMATYTAETRTKEIGIRKVLGSSVFEIIVLLSRSFVGLLLLAVLLATPVAYFLNNAWLEFFASRVSVSLAIILASVLILLVVSLLIVLSQSWRVARANPVKSLKTE